MFENIYYQKLKYKEYNGKSSSGVDTYKPVTEIDGLRIKGKSHIKHTPDGDTTYCDITYRTPGRLIPKSTIDGHEVVESVAVAGFGVDCGYVNYVK